jgi:xanthine dehydrogenase YagR molybdenum-binding subunit
MTAPVRTRSVGRPIERLDGRGKVTGTAPYAYDQPVAEPMYLYPLRASHPRATLLSMDGSAALAVHDSVRLLTADNAPRLPAGAPAALRVLQDADIAYYGQFIGAVLADTPEIARHAAALVTVAYDILGHDTEVRADHPDRYAPDMLHNGHSPPDADRGDWDAAVQAADAYVDRIYRTPGHHHVPLEPHTTVAIWTVEDGTEQVTLYESTQGAAVLQLRLAPALGLRPDQLKVIAPFVGGGFGAKVTPQAHHILTVMAARAVPGRAVKFAMPRRHTFVGTSYRTPTIQRVRLGARSDGSLTAIGHDSVQQTARHGEFTEPAALGSRSLYGSYAHSSSHRLVPLDVSVPGFMRAPGEGPGSFALESAMDELAVELGIDPVELRIRNEPATDPDSGRPFSSRDLIWCLRVGARRFGWGDRDPAPRTRQEGEWWLGTGVAAASYPFQAFPPSSAAVHALPGGRYRVELAAADIGTGAWTILSQIAADALDVAVPDVDVVIGSSSLPFALAAVGSAGTTAWSEAVLAAVAAFRSRHGAAPPVGAQAEGRAAPDTEGAKFARFSFGAQFAEVAVHADTGELRVRRMLGAFDVGRVINPRTARSQLIGGMVMGLSMALHEESVMDHRYGHVVNHDLASYHVAAHADVPDMQALWLGVPDPRHNTLGAKGLGEIGVVGVAAAIANAAWHATGRRVRELPLTVDDFTDLHSSAPSEIKETS